MNTDDDLRRLGDRLAVATADAGHQWVDDNVHQVLRALRQHLAMDVVFVSRFVGGRRQFAAVDAAPEHAVLTTGASDPLETSWCHRVATARMPQLVRDARPLIDAGEVPATPLRIGTHLSVPIVLDDGSVYGTLCTFAIDRVLDVDEPELKQLRVASELIARRIGTSR